MAILNKGELDYRIARSVEEELKRLAETPLRDRDEDDRTAFRKEIISPADALALERIVGRRDLQHVNYLTRGMRAARPVCRIRIRRRDSNLESFGTGFIVAPGLLVTNRHVLPNADVARYSLAEFDYELDENFVTKTPRVFNLLPSDIFQTSPTLDYAFVAAASFAHDGTPLAEFGSLPLIRQSGKALHGEYVTLIQHPGGQPKQIVIRESQVILLRDDPDLLGDDLIPYTSDTEPGSSGAPVLNDEFQVVALHQRAIPAVNSNGDILNRDGEIWDASQSEDDKKWVANAGIRISAILRSVEAAAQSDFMARAVLRRFNSVRLNTTEPISVRTAPLRPDDDGEAPPFESSRFEGATGYDPDFHGVRIPLPAVRDDKLGEPTSLEDGTGTELKYTHFSIVMNRARRLAYFTAVNIDGESFDKPSSGVGGSWRFDPRVPNRSQSDNNLYKDDETEPRQLDRGHLVRRLDPAWGTQAEIDRAVDDTYHWTNAAPQEHGYNDQIWGNLEDLLLIRAAEADNHMTVISGPVFGDLDRAYGHNRKHGPYVIPEAFWKVVAFTRPDGRLSATGYRLFQTSRIDPLFESSRFHGFDPFTIAESQTFQVSVEKIERMTNLDFGGLKQHDPIAGLESTEQVRPIRSASDFVI